MTVPAISNVDLKLLSVFRAVVNNGGFSLAQAELNVSQATISIHIKNLENRLGLTLCQRGRGGFALTDDGQRTFDAANALFSHIDDFRAQVLGDEKLVGELHIAIIDNTVTHPSFGLSTFIDQFGQPDHNVDITVHVAPPNRLERMVLSGEAHIGIGFFPRKLAQLDYHPAFISNMELYCGAKHPLFEKGLSKVTIKEVEAAQHAQRGYVSIDQTPDLHRSFNFRAHSASIEGLLHLVLSGRYLGFLPKYCAAPLVASGELASVLPKTYAYQSHYDIIRQNSTAQIPAAAKFYELLTT